MLLKTNTLIMAMKSSFESVVFFFVPDTVLGACSVCPRLASVTGCVDSLWPVLQTGKLRRREGRLPAEVWDRPARLPAL